MTMEQTSPQEENQYQDYEDVLEYIKKYWTRLIRNPPQTKIDRNTLLPVPYRYLVPSEQSMFSEMYYWDTYFISLGLMGSSPDEDLIIEMAENLGHLFQEYGIIPNANRGYFLSRSQPPLFTKIIWLAYEVKQRKGHEDARSFLKKMIKVAEQEHDDVWLGENQPHHRLVKEKKEPPPPYFGLSRYFDTNYLHELASCESGWDHSPRCGCQWLNHLPIDLNSILYAREMDFSRAYSELKNPWHANLWNERAKTRKKQINEFMWDEEHEFFFDYNFVDHNRNPIPSLAGFFPLWAKCATPEQAQRMVNKWLGKFEHKGGLATTTEEDVNGKKIEVKDKNGHNFQWVYPNGWAPLQWIVVKGLENYKSLNYEFHNHAQRIRRKWCNTCKTVFRASGNLWEKYNVVDVGKPPVFGDYDQKRWEDVGKSPTLSDDDSMSGFYGSVPGFGWTNGVFVDFVRSLYATDERHPSTW